MTRTTSSSLTASTSCVALTPATSTDTRSQIIRQLAARLGCGEAALTDFHARKACGSTQAVGFTFRYQNETYQYDYKNKEMEKING